jgi:hypothetical protein
LLNTLEAAGYKNEQAVIDFRKELEQTKENQERDTKHYGAYVIHDEENNSSRTP